ncbi:MAG: TIR domain-containing protein [Symploca sp. SIO2E9]|nr:TIR domain-containing protein [Symploca sp. SIO2E9]
MNETFLSYSRKDLDLARFLKQHLESYGFSLWQDLEDLPVGEPWRQEVQVAIQKSINVLCLITEDFIASDNCQWEVQQALAHNKRLIPVARIGFANFQRLGLAIRELNCVFIGDEPSVGLKRLVEALEFPWGKTPGDRLDAYLDFGDYRLPLLRNRYYLGRYPRGDWQIVGLILVPHKDVSRHHATLLLTDNRWTITDGAFTFSATGKFLDWASSKNGTFVNHKPIHHQRPFFYPLRHGDQLRLSANCFITFREILAAGRELYEDKDASQETSW